MSRHDFEVRTSAPYILNDVARFDFPLRLLHLHPRFAFGTKSVSGLCDAI